MSKNPSRIARMYRMLSPEEDAAAPKRAVPTGWVVGLVAVPTLALPVAVFSSVLGADRGEPDPDLAAVRVSSAEADDDDGADDDRDRDRSRGDATVRETADGNTLRDGAYSLTGNTKIGDTTERATQDGNTARDGDNSITGNTRGGDSTLAPARAAAPAVQGFAPAYGPAGGDSVSGGDSASG